MTFAGCVSRMKALALAVCVLAAATMIVPTAAAGPFECYDIYNEWHVGPYTIVQRNSCSYEICYEDECGLLQ